MKTVFKTFLIVVIITTQRANAQSEKIISGFNHLESIASNGKYMFAADIGKELNPASKDGDGKIFKLNLKGKIIDSSFTKEILNAPKGLVINKGILFVNDIDRLLAIDLKTGIKLYEIDFSNSTSFLNDIAVWDNNILYVSATDVNKIFKVNLIDKSYSELKTDKIIAGINGLFCFKKSNQIYVNGFGNDNNPNGIVGYIDLKKNEFNQLTQLKGNYDGISIYNNVLYLSSWGSLENSGTILAIGIYNYNSQKVLKINTLEPISGPADFIISYGKLIVPAMISGKIHFITLDKNLSLKF